MVNGRLYMKAHGEFDPRTARAVFLKWVRYERGKTCRVLWDVTRVTGLDFASSSERLRFEMSESIAAALPKDVRLAILETPQQLPPDNIDEYVMRIWGAKVKVTSNLEDALDWLKKAPLELACAAGAP